MIKKHFSINYFVNFTKPIQKPICSFQKEGTQSLEVFFIKQSYRNKLAISKFRNFNFDFNYYELQKLICFTECNKSNFGVRSFQNKFLLFPHMIQSHKFAKLYSII